MQQQQQKKKKKKKTVRGNPIGFRVQRLNLSATVTPFCLLEYKVYKMTLLSKFHAYLTM